MPTKFDDMSFVERERYYDAYTAARRAQIEAIGKMEIRAREDDVDAEERAKIAEDIRAVEANIAILDARRALFEKGAAEVTPPDDAMIAAIRDLTQQVEQETVERNVAAAVVALASNALAAFSEIQPRLS